MLCSKNIPTTKKFFKEKNTKNRALNAAAADLYKLKIKKTMI